MPCLPLLPLCVSAERGVAPGVHGEFRLRGEAGVPRPHQGLARLRGRERSREFGRYGGELMVSTVFCQSKLWSKLLFTNTTFIRTVCDSGACPCCPCEFRRSGVAPRRTQRVWTVRGDWSPAAASGTRATPRRGAKRRSARTGACVPTRRGVESSGRRSTL